MRQACAVLMCLWGGSIWDKRQKQVWFPASVTFEGGEALAGLISNQNATSFSS